MTDRSLVVLEGGRFTLGPPGQELEEIELDAMVTLVGGSSDLRPAAAVPLLPGAAAPPVPDWVMPGCARLAWVGGGSVDLYDDGAGAWRHLTAQHVRVLAGVAGPVAVASLVDGSGLTGPVAAVLIDELLAVGLVVPVPVAVPSDSPPAPAAPPPVSAAPEPVRHDGRIPVLSFWATDEGPHLGSAAVVAYARQVDDGALGAVFDLRRPQRAHQVLEEVRASSGPVVLLCSDYLWSLEANLEVAAEALAANPATLVVHGGPCAPRYDEDCARFLRSLPPRHVVVAGEGEITFVEILRAIATAWRPGDPTFGMEVLDGIAGVRYLDPTTDEVVRNPDRPRHPTLGDFPSPLLSGEFDDVPLDVLNGTMLPVETNRGCPYGCTFCDWGQNTMARIRTFPLERVAAEFDWLAARGVKRWMVADANFGILPRDLDIVEEVVRHRIEHGLPEWFVAAPPKNTTKRLTQILDRLLGVGIPMKCALGLQTRDPGTLEAVRRTNIGTTSYDELAIHLRRRGLPLNCDLMLGLPGSSVASLKDDLQWCLEQRVRPLLHNTFVLPNSPMNDPDYRAEHGLVIEDGLIVSTSGYTREQRAEMGQVAAAFVISEILGHLRHILRYLQWDHGLRAIDVVHDLLRLTAVEPSRYPLLDWTFRNTDLFVIPPVGWGPFYAEVHRALVDGLGVVDDAPLRTAIAVNRFVMPVAGRTYPDVLELEHDYVRYFREASATLLITGKACAPDGPLASYGPGRLEILADPDSLDQTVFGRSGDARVSGASPTDFYFVTHLELLSPLITYLPMTSPDFVAQARDQIGGLDVLPVAAPDEQEPDGGIGPVPVELRRR